MFLKKVLSSVFSMLLLLLISANAHAQLGTSNVTGVVTDSTSAVVGGATVVFKNEATGQTREITTGEDGRFVMQNLAPAQYLVMGSAEGFSSVQVEHFLVRVGEVASVRITLKPDVNKEVVEVKASDATGVDIVSTQVAGYMTDEKIANLPLNGRNFLDLAFLLPGNAPAAIYDPSKTNTVLVSSLGQFGRGGNVAIDGGDNNDDQTGGALQNLPLDSVREFQIATSSFGADIGRSASSAVNIVTKSGSNEYHLSAGFFFRNKGLSALPATLNRDVVRQLGEPSFDREQYTVSFGGPLKRDKAWFFNSFEYRKQDSILLTTERVSSLGIVNSYGPAPLRDALLLSRVDYQLNLKDKFAVRYAFQDANDTSSGLTLATTGSFANREKEFNTFHNVAFNYVHIFSSRFLNDLVVQESHFSNDIPQASVTPELHFPSLTDGGNSGLPQAVRQNRVQFRDNISLEIGKHSLKFGGEYHRINGRIDAGFLTQGQVFLGENFATQDRNMDGSINDLDLPILFTIRSTNPNTVRINDLNNNYFGTYVQDTWKATRRLSLTLGLRYEVDTNNTGRDQFSDFAPIQTRRPEIDGNNFAPRIGFNLDLFGDARTSIHGAYGIYYDRIVSIVPQLTRLFNTKSAAYQIKVGSFIDEQGNFFPGSPTLADPFSGPVIPGATIAGIYTIDPNIKTPYVQQFSFGIRQQIAKDFILSVDGIHSFGSKFLLDRTVGSAFNPLLGTVDSVIEYESSLKNWYDALFINVEKRASNRFSFIASYTLSKTFNFYDGDQLSRVVSITPLDQNNIGQEKSLSLLDQRHRFSFAAVVDLPYGIQLAPIFTAQSSLPIDILRPDGMGRIPGVRNAGARQFKTGAQLNTYINQLNAAGGDIDGSPLPLVPNNIKLGDNFYNFDMRVTKTFKFGDRFNVQGIMEVFNLFNRTNIRGFSSAGGGFAGVQNVLVRDTFNPFDPAFLSSSSFGAKLKTAGGVFGSGGPRAFQFAVKVNF